MGVYMKIVHLCLGNFFIDGGSYQENMLTKYHSKMGYDVTVIARLFSYNNQGVGTLLDHATEYINPDGVKVVRLDYIHPRKYGRFTKKYKGLAAALKKESPNIIFCHNLQFGGTGIVSKYLKANPSVVLYADNHGDYVNSARNWLSLNLKHRIMWKYYVNKLVPYLTKYYGVTPMRCNFLKEVYDINPELIEFLPMGVDDDAIPGNKEEVRSIIRKELSISDDEIIIMTGGKLELRKNPQYLYEAFETLNNSRIHLVVCGTFTPEVESLRSKMESDRNIHLLGWCDSTRVMNVMVASDFVCFPGTHSTLWEQAVGLGLPAIFKYWKDIDHVNVNGNCIFVKGDDVKEIADAIHILAKKENYDHYKSLANKASTGFLYSNIAKKAIGQSV